MELKQLQNMYAEVLKHRTLINTASVILIALCVLLVAFGEPVRERLLDWMRWYLWGYRS